MEANMRCLCGSAVSATARQRGATGDQGLDKKTTDLCSEQTTVRSPARTTNYSNVTVGWQIICTGGGGGVAGGGKMIMVFRGHPPQVCNNFHCESCLLLQYL